MTRIPACYRQPLQDWSYKTFGVRTEAETYNYAVTHGLYISPAISQTHIVFAICRESDNVMTYALKLVRDHEKDADFVRQALTLAKLAK